MEPWCFVDPNPVGSRFIATLARSLRRQRDYLDYVRRCDKAGAGQDDAVRDGIEVRLVQRQEDNGQVSLEILLLVNGKQYLTILDPIQHIRRQVEGSQLDLP